MTKAPRIAVGQTSSESNHFVPFRADLEFFRDTGYVYEGDDVLKLAGTDSEIGGALATLRDSGAQIVPLLAARGNSSGPLTRNCFDHFRARMLHRLEQAGEIDGVFLSHHGSMCADGEPDCEGNMIEAVRRVVGPRVPIAVTLDLHGNVTRRMMQSADLIVGYEHYPHDDVFTTGQRGASLLLRTIRGEIRPAMALAKLPMLMTGFNASTDGAGPFARAMTNAKTLERREGVLAVSLFHVGSYIDVPDIGCATLVCTDGDAKLAQELAGKLSESYWSARQEFRVQTLSVADAVRRGEAIAGGPVLLLDTSDTTGGGACGDGIGLLRGLREARVEAPCVAMVVDPPAARACHQAGTGANVTLDVGHSIDSRWGKPLRITGKIERISDGRFRYTGGILGGNWATMGPSAVVNVGSIQILIMTRPTYDWGREQYESVAIDVRGAKFVGVKNMMNFRFGYRDVMKGYFVLNLPGPTPPDMTLLNFRHVPRPLFPLDEIERPEIRLYHSRRSDEAAE